MVAFPALALDNGAQGEEQGSSLINTLIHGRSGKDQSSVSQQDLSPASQPDLSQLIPLATDLAGRYERLQSSMKDVPDISSIEENYAEIEEKMKEIALQIKSIKTSSDYSVVRIAHLMQILWDEREFSQEIGTPLRREIRRLASWKTEWLAEKKRWSDWETVLLKDRMPDQLGSSFAKAHDTIDSALNLVLQQLDTMLKIQAKGSAVETRIDALKAETQAFISSARRHYFLAESPPMFSPAYISQFRGELWQTTVGNLGVFSWPSRRYFVRHGWAMPVQFFFSFALILAIYRNRRALNESERWRFLAARPVSVGLFTGTLILLLAPNYMAFSETFKMVYKMTAAVSFIRLLGPVIEQSWKKQAAYGAIILFVITDVMTAVSLPLPLYRLYTFLVSVIAIRFLWRWSGESARQNDSRFYAWSLRLGLLLMGFIAVMQVMGKKGIAGYFFNSSLTSLTIILVFSLFIYLIRGGIHWVFFASPVWKIKNLRSEAESLSRRAGILIQAVMVVLVILPTVLTTWGFFVSIPEATAGLLALGFNAGAERISVGLVIAATVVLYGSVLLSQILPRVLLDEAVTGRELAHGVRLSVGRLIHYFIVFIGFLLMIAVLGLDLTKLTIIISALGVGIGFGLQGVVNNFVSGLILLFEQPVRMGDIVEIGGNWAEIKRIGLRATTIQTFDQADVIIPNADLVSNQVTNWTLSNRLVRLIIPVGVAYGSDVPRVMATLRAAGEDNELIAN